MKNGKKVRFGFSLSAEKEREIEQKNLEVCMVVFLSIPGHHEKITVRFHNEDINIIVWSISGRVGCLSYIWLMKYFI